MKPTTKPNETYQFANEIDFSKYSAIVAVGGDGTVSEIVNGMLARKDGKKLPISIIPNGSGNWMATLLGIFDIEMAIDTLVAKTVAKFSVLECLADADNKSEIPESERKSRVKIATQQCIVGPFYTRFIKAAIPFKPCFGPIAYILACFKIPFSKRWREQYKLEIDGKDPL